MRGTRDCGHSRRLARKVFLRRQTRCRDTGLDIEEIEMVTPDAGYRLSAS
jgi:hypothetical protein